jgi:hypothetical protein
VPQRHGGWVGWVGVDDDVSAIVAGAVVELPPQVITRHQTARPPGTPATT